MMTLEEIREYRSLTSGGYCPLQLNDVSIEGIKKFREQFPTGFTVDQRHRYSVFDSFDSLVIENLTRTVRQLGLKWPSECL